MDGYFDPHLEQSRFIGGANPMRIWMPLSSRHDAVRSHFFASANAFRDWSGLGTVRQLLRKHQEGSLLLAFVFFGQLGDRFADRTATFFEPEVYVGLDIRIIDIPKQMALFLR